MTGLGGCAAASHTAGRVVGVKRGQSLDRDAPLRGTRVRPDQRARRLPTRGFTGAAGFVVISPSRMASVRPRPAGRTEGLAQRPAGARRRGVGGSALLPSLLVINFVAVLVIAVPVHAAAVHASVGGGRWRRRCAVSSGRAPAVALNRSVTGWRGG
jgi:hypothetical protein